MLLAPVCSLPAIAVAQENPSIDKFYQSLKDTVYDDFQKFLEMAAQERQRKIREKLPPSTDKQVAEGTSGIKFLLYNKAILFVICAESADRSVLPEKGIAVVNQCVSSKTVEMMKYLKLNDHAATFGNKKLVSCAIKARDFQREARFPPFDFLRDPNGPEIIDFAAAIDCITTGP
ncbi:hypothetical protein IQ16_03234 [Bradyrhizobium huanghuaihaiense]|uniref:Uncharacterized protein n=2 Tax=Bradyrhizobium huanghuaihaiense TaxID=990078 RepID=A0A562RPE3_9BRAD|nr:hypothetical protein IQ16_03234 [Bradyrhizobium huanghuaihaiense]